MSGRRKELLPDLVRDVRLTAAVTNTPGALDAGANWFCPVGRERRAQCLSCAEGMFYLSSVLQIAWLGQGEKPGMWPPSPRHCCGCSVDRMTPRVDDKQFWFTA